MIVYYTKKALRNQMIQFISIVLYFPINHKTYNLIVINKWISKTASIYNHH